VSKSGFLTKLPSTEKAFARPHKRYFVLEGAILMYTLPYAQNIPRRMLKLLGAGVAIGESKGSRKSVYEIRVLPRDMGESGERCFRMCTESKAEARSWGEAILNNINWANERVEIEKAKTSKLLAGEGRRKSHVGEDLSERPHDHEIPKTYYEILGVPPDADSRQIKVTYHNLAKNFHPDKNPDIDTKAFAEIGHAYQVLKDKTLRANYDLCETVKAAFRLGVLANKHEADGTTKVMAFFLDRDFQDLYWQEEDKGSVLKPNYSRVELRYVHKILAAEDDETCPPLNSETISRCVSIHMSPHAKSLGYKTIFMELDTEQARNDILDGLRVLRCAASMLFQQNLDAMKAEGLR